MTSGDIYMLSRIFSTTGTLSGQLYFSLFLFTSWMVSSQVLFSPLFSFLSLSPLFSFHSLSPLFSFLSLSPLFISFFLFFLAPEFFLARNGVPKIYRISRPDPGLVSPQTKGGCTLPTRRCLTTRPAAAGRPYQSSWGHLGTLYLTIWGIFAIKRWGKVVK